MNDKICEALLRDIMNIPTTGAGIGKGVEESMKCEGDIESKLVLAYRIGHRDARHAAADLVALLSAEPAKSAKCECTMAKSLVGDGCRYCQPQEYIDRLEEEVGRYFCSRMPCSPSDCVEVPCKYLSRCVQQPEPAKPSESAMECPPEVMEKLAEIEHRRWAGQALTALNEMTEERRERWGRLALIPYTDLDAHNKELDRMQIREWWPIVGEWAQRVAAAAVHKEREKLKDFAHKTYVTEDALFFCEAIDAASKEED